MALRFVKKFLAGGGRVASGTAPASPLADTAKQRGISPWAEVRRALIEGWPTEDVIQLAGAAAEKEGRGYRQDSAFGFKPSQAREDLGRLRSFDFLSVLPNLTPEVQTHLRAAFCLARLRGDGVEAASRLVAAVLLGQPLDWPELERWRRRFAQAGKRPYMWTGLDLNSKVGADEATIDALATIRNLSSSARMILALNFAIDCRTTRPVHEIRGRSHLAADEFGRSFVELQRAGLAEFPLGTEARLLTLNIKDLRAALRRLGLKSGRRKAEMVFSLLQSAHTDELDRLLARVPADLAMVGWDAPPHLAHLIDQEMTRLLLLSHTIYALLDRERDFREFLRAAGEGRTLRIVSPEEDCPVCPEWAGKRIDAAGLEEKNMPPFHPGCRCYMHFDLPF